MQKVYNIPVNYMMLEMNIDLVIMGTKGETSDHNTTFGSYTIEVFKYVKCPVLAIPEDFLDRVTSVTNFGSW